MSLAENKLVTIRRNKIKKKMYRSENVYPNTCCIQSTPVFGLRTFENYHTVLQCSVSFVTPVIGELIVYGVAMATHLSMISPRSNQMHSNIMCERLFRKNAVRRKEASSVRQINSLINSVTITTKMLHTFKKVPNSVSSESKIVRLKLSLCLTN
jgi:hypothetical protein